MINSKKLKQYIGTKAVIHTLNKEESIELIQACYDLGLKLRNKKELEDIPKFQERMYFLNDDYLTYSTAFGLWKFVCLEYKVVEFVELDVK